jgi:hypothetical protein
VIEPIVLVVVLEKAEYACKIRWGAEDEDEYKDEYESLTGCVVRVFRFGVVDFGFRIEMNQKFRNSKSTIACLCFPSLACLAQPSAADRSLKSEIPNPQSRVYACRDVISLMRA